MAQLEACWAHNPKVDGSKPSLAIFVLVFMGTQIKKSIFNASLFGFAVFLSLILVNYIAAPQIEIMNNEPRKLMQYAFHLLNITSCVLILIHLKNNRESSYFLNRRIVNNQKNQISLDH